MEDQEFKTPGQYIQHLLSERGWTQRVLAIVLAIDETGLNKIITGKRPLDAELALALSVVFEQPPKRFLALQNDYDLAVARAIARPDTSLADRAKLFGDLPLSDMVKRGWLPGVTDLKDVKDLQAGLKLFFGADSPSETLDAPHAAKKSDESSPVSATQAVWLRRVRQMANELLVARFSQEALDNLIENLSHHLGQPEGTRVVPRLMTEAGIRFVVVEGLPGAKIDGVCTWLDDDKPVIGMTMRFDRIDNFWFVLRHELEHVRLGHGKRAAIIDADLDTENPSERISTEERLANAAAAAFCVDQDALTRFIAKKTPYFSDRDLVGFARTLEIDPGLVAGQLQRRLGRYDRFRNHLAKVRNIVLPNALSDGWGTVAPI